MTAEIYVDWYVCVFIPGVKKHPQNKGKTGKVLLIIDNSPTLPSLIQLHNNINKDFKVQFLYPIVTMLLHLMGQGVIEEMKIC